MHIKGREEKGLMEKLDWSLSEQGQVRDDKGVGRRRCNQELITDVG